MVRSFLEIPRIVRRSSKLISAELRWSTRILLTLKFSIASWMISGIYLLGFSLTKYLSSKIRGGRLEVIFVDGEPTMLIISCHFLFIVFLVSPPSTRHPPKITIAIGQLVVVGAMLSGSESLSSFFETFSNALTTYVPFPGDCNCARSLPFLHTI